MKKLTAVVLLFLLVPASSLFAQGKGDSKKELTVPFEITHTGHQIVTLMYGKKEIRMILDTGAGANVFSLKAAKKLKLKSQKSGNKAAGVGTQSHAMLDVAPIILGVDGEKMKLQNIKAMNLAHVEVAGGAKGMHGLLGSPFFRTHNVKIDFSNNTMTIRKK